MSDVPEKPGPSAFTLVTRVSNRGPKLAEYKPKPEQCKKSAMAQADKRRDVPSPDKPADKHVSKSLAAVERAWRDSGAKPGSIEGSVDGNGTWFSGCFDES